MILVSQTPSGAALAAAAAVSGIGVGLTLDEFALWLNLKDVYWPKQGRQSVDAIFCVLVITGALIGGASFVTGGIGTAEWWSSLAGIEINLVLCVIRRSRGRSSPASSASSSASWRWSGRSGWPSRVLGGRCAATPPGRARPAAPRAATISAAWNGGTG
jgi:hypothetical protein